MEKREMKNLSLFSDETLGSIAMAEVLGGADNCHDGNCGNCVTQCGCNSKSGTGSCNTVKVNAAGVCLNDDEPMPEDPIAVTDDPYAILP